MEMENYKELNAELVLKVQELKIHIGIYQKEVLALHGQCMEERRRRVEMQHHLLRILSRNFQQTVDEIDPNVKIVELFTDRNDIDELTPRCLSKERSADSRELYEEKGRRSSSAGLLVQELRRSSAMQQFAAMVTKSPSKRRSDEKLNDSAAENSPAASGQSVFDVSNTETFSENGNNCNEENNHIETIVAGNSFQAEEQPSQLENIMEDDERFLGEESSLQKTKYTPLREIGNKQMVSPKVRYSASSPSSPECHHIRVVVQRGKIRNVERQRPNDSIQEGRFERNRTESDPDTNASGSSTRKSASSANSPQSFVMGDISISNFACAISSTPFKPQSNEISTENVVSSTVAGSTPTSYTTASTLMAKTIRPRRKCTPNNLSEPNLRHKLRNDTSVRTSTSKENRPRKRV